MSSLDMFLTSLLRIIFIKKVEGKRAKRHKSERTCKGNESMVIVSDQTCLRALRSKALNARKKETFL